MVTATVVTGEFVSVVFVTAFVTGGFSVSPSFFVVTSVFLEPGKDVSALPLAVDV